MRINEEELEEIKETARKDGFRAGFWAAEDVYDCRDESITVYPTEESVKQFLATRAALETIKNIRRIKKARAVK